MPAAKELLHLPAFQKHSNMERYPSSYPEFKSSGKMSARPHARIEIQDVNVQL